MASGLSGCRLVARSSSKLRRPWLSAAAASRARTSTLPGPAAEGLPSTAGLLGRGRSAPSAAASQGEAAVLDDRRSSVPSLARTVAGTRFYKSPSSPQQHASNVLTVTSDAEFAKALQDAQEANRAAVVDFTASWCGPCRQIAPHFDALSARMPDVSFLKVDIDEEALQDTVAHAKVRAVYKQALGKMRLLAETADQMAALPLPVLCVCQSPGATGSWMRRGREGDPLLADLLLVVSPGQPTFDVHKGGKQVGRVEGADISKVVELLGKAQEQS